MRRMFTKLFQFDNEAFVVWPVVSVMFLYGAATMHGTAALVLGLAGFAGLVLSLVGLGIYYISGR